MSEENQTPSANPVTAAHRPPLIRDHQLLRQIGRGNYGEVWLALDAMKKWRAVKIVHRGPGDDRRAYQQEFRGLCRYDEFAGSDDSLLPIKNVGQDEAAGFFHYTMDLADDATTLQPLPRPTTTDASTLDRLAAAYRPRTLSEEIRRHGRLPPADCIAHGLALAKSLQVLHEHRLIHRDVKPSNIIFVNGRPKLADIGLVAALDATMISYAGTSGFVPLHGAGEPTGDLFALGKVLYLAATGKDVRDFPAALPNLETLPTEERHQLAELQAVYEKACDPSPEERQPSAQALGDELDLLRRNESVVRLRQLEEERKAYEVQQREFQRLRKKVLVASSAVVALILVAVAALLVNWWRLRAAHAATVAELQAGQLSRMLTREDGWSTRDWQKVEQAAARKLDGNVIGQAVSTMSGLDGHRLARWDDVEVSTVAFAPDGRALFAGYGTNHALLVTGATNRTALPVVGEGKACWAPDGEPLILQTASNQCVLRVARTGAIRGEFAFAPGEGVAVGALPATAVSSDGGLVAAALTNATGARIVVWDTATGRVFGEDRVVPRDWAGEAKRWLLAVGDLGANIAVWDLTKRVPRAFYAGSAWNVQSVAFSPDGVTLASAGRNSPSLWDVMTGRGLLVAAGINGSDQTALAFDANGTVMAAGGSANSAGGMAGLLRIEPHRCVQGLRGLRSTVRKVWFSRDSKLLAALADDWSLPVWEISTGRLRHLIEVPAGELADNAGGAFDATGTRFGFAAGHSARLYDLETGRTLGDWVLPHGFGEEAQFDPGGRLLLVRRERSPEHPRRSWRWTLYELPPGAAPVVMRRQEDLSYRAVSMAFPAPGSRWVVFTEDWTTAWNSVRAFDVLTGVESWRLEKVDRGAYEVLHSDGGGNWCWFNASAPPDKPDSTQFVHASNGQTVATILGGARALSPDGQELAAARPPGLLSWELRRLDGTGPEIVFGHDAIFSGDTYQFSPDGRHFAWGTIGGEVFLANLPEVRRRLATLPNGEHLRRSP